MFRPMALTVIFALAASLVLALTLMPVLASLVLRGRVRARRAWSIARLKPAYAPLLERRCATRSPAIGVALARWSSQRVLAPQLGAEFIPGWTRATSLIQAVALPRPRSRTRSRRRRRSRRPCAKFPEVETWCCKTGRPEIATDPMGVEPDRHLRSS